jgi:hypothetical protein
MGDDAIADPACQVCGRRLLPGERATLYLTRDGAEASVCELCRPRAEAAGWLLPHEAEARGGVGRERRRPRGQMLGSLLSRLPAAAAGEPQATEAPPEEAAARARSRRPPVEPRPATEPRAMRDPAGDEKRGTSVADAIAAFNHSNHRRTVAGLTRTLGPPRATALAIRTSDGSPGARLTVAWELTWYQWEVGSGAAGPEVRESGKGETIDQLRAADRTWNLLVASDGTLEQRVAPAAEDEEGE